MNVLRALPCLLGCLFLAPAARAETYQLKSGNFNTTYIAPATVPAGSNEATTPATPDSNFQGMGSVAGSVGPISTSSLRAERFPSNLAKSITLVGNTIGGPFASGAPLYFMGDEILPPLVGVDGRDLLPGGTDEERLAEARLHWRPQPVLPGENIPGMGVVIPTGTVTVTSADPNSPTVLVAASPPPIGLVVGATLLGEPITKITGTGTGPFAVTLAGKANEAITSNSVRPVVPATSYYYSPHAEKVFASQAGQVTITWINAGLKGLRTESPIVSATTQRPVRTIYWTKGSFDGPVVRITDARITSINPAYTNTVPKAVPEEVSIPGYTPLTPDLTTLSFDKFNGTGQLHAHNVEGRILIEYLGNVRLGDTYESLGIDVVEIKREPVVFKVVQNLGTELTPRTPFEPGDEELEASPVLSNSQGGAGYYGTVVRDDGSLAYFAERTTSGGNNPDNGEPASSDAYNKVVFYWLEAPADNFGIKWPKFQTRYWQRWSPNLDDYAHYTVGPTGSTPDTGVSFSGGTLPAIVWQDDPAQSEARIDLPTQRLFVTLAPTNPHQRNRSLLKFSSSGEAWYVSLYTQAESRQTTRSVEGNGTATVTLTGAETTTGLEVGMTGIADAAGGAATIVSIPDLTHFVLSRNVSTAATFTFTVEADGGPPLHAAATVGARIAPPAGHEVAGYISGGTGYYPDGYLDPFTVGVKAANLGAIIPVNARPGDNVLTVRWFRKVPAPSGDFQDLYVPGKVGHYTVNYPASGPAGRRIVIAENVGTGDLSAAEGSGHVYVQNDSNLPGYNPNEEHAFMAGGRAYALREDLNVTTQDDKYTSDPFLLLAYIDPSDQRPAMNAYEVLREVDLNDDRIVDPGDILFDYTATAGTLLSKPYPLPFLPQPMVGTGDGRTSKDLEIFGADLPANSTVVEKEAYKGFTIEDRKGFTWIHRGPHSGGTPGIYRSTGDGTVTVTVASTADLAEGMSVSGSGLAAPATIVEIIDATTLELSEPLQAGTWALTYGPRLSMKLYYLSQPGFFLPGSGEAGEGTVLAEGTVLPFLRQADRSGQTLDIGTIDANADGSPGDPDEPLTITYRPAWPTNAPELRVGETLTLPKFDLPQVRGQTSAEVYYQQSIARAATATQLTKNSVVLHDPTRQKTLALGTGTLDKLPDVIRTTSYQGKTYFQGLPPHLQQRFYFDPLAGPKGTLYFVGEFHHGPDEGFSGDDYLDLNLPSPTDADALKGLVPAGDDATGKANWDGAIDLLKTEVETPIPDPARVGFYKADPEPEQVFATSSEGSRNPVAVISASDTLVDSYAVTATGQGTGFVTMVFGNGGNPDQQPQGDPVQVKVFKIAEQLYVGDLKVLLSSNPLDEQVTLRHSGDFAGKPEDYEFEWRWTFGAASAPATYTSTMMKRIGDPLALTDKWHLVNDPGALRATDAQYTASPALALGSHNVHPVTGIFTSQGQLVGLPATRISVSPTAGLTVGMSVTGGGITGTASIVSIIDRDPDGNVGSYVLSQVIPDATSTLTYGASLEFSSTSTPLLSPFDESRSYTEAERTAGYPALMAKSSTGVDFSPGSYPLGVPERIVFSARLGNLDGCVLYVNGRVALAYNAPTPQFTLTNARTGLTAIGDPDQPGGDAALRQFNLAPGFFNPGPNTIEVAIYSTADANAHSDLDFILEAAAETDNVLSGSTWQTASDPTGRNTNVAIVGGSPSNPFGGPQFVLNDRWFTMRYRPKADANNVLGTPWSRWAPPQFVEGWVKRVLAAINPFEQRVKDLYNNAVNTDVSLLTQAGGRWEGDIALNMDAVNDAGLIAIYETVLNRAKDMSINANTNDPDTNNALLLAAGYLNDLYTIVGNEAFADAANPTISIDDPSSVFEVNTSRFAFEGQVASSLDEELALLRGRDDFVSPGVATAPVYNRLIWNYTRGINSGEALYAVNYNITEKAGSSTADGVIDESDAQRMFPQGHGDAYGHYLTALTGYYRLLTNGNFSWQARGEAVTVNGQAVTVDFQDERKFAAAAGNLARTAEQVVALTYRQSYVDDPAAGWSSYRDTRAQNPQTGVTPQQGLDEWVSRSTQGAFYHWVVGNALVPELDEVHTGVQKIDRTTVPELPQLAAAGASFQATIDNASAHLNPLGLSPGAVAFDINPLLMARFGQTQYVQIHDRALRSLNNAAGAFNQAARMTRSLRDQTNAVDDFNTTIVQQEVAYMNQLIDIFGRPYSADIGPGRLYAQGYHGPDFHHWFIVDRPTGLTETGATFEVSLDEAVEVAYYTGDSLTDISGVLLDSDERGAPVTTYRSSTVTINPSQWVQYADVWKPEGLGSRPMTGELQEALQDAQETWMDLYELNVEWQRQTAQLEHLGRVFNEMIRTHTAATLATETNQAKIRDLEGLVRDLEISADVLDNTAESGLDLANALIEVVPKMNGTSNDVTSVIRGTTLIAGTVGYILSKVGASATRAASLFQQSNILAKEHELERVLQKYDFSLEEIQLAYEYQQMYVEAVTGATELMQLLVPHQRALQRVNNVLAKGDRILAEREVFRHRAAALIQGYRTRDLTFRVFRNEALEQYRSLFDLASRYTYLSAKAYDYETGLLGSEQGQAVFNRIVASRSLGDLTGGVPQSTTSTLGDGGLAGVMAQLDADFSAAEGRLGINNPDYYGTVFSLRAELFRLLDDPAITSDDEAWQQTLEQHIVADVLGDADVATHCRNIAKPDGSPVPGIIIEFGSTIQHGRNFFGLPLAAYDHAFSASSYGTKISNTGIVFRDYIGMDPSIGGSETTPETMDHALSGNPYVYLIPCGVDYMRAPLSGGEEVIRSWRVQDEALPLPYNLGASDFNTTQFFSANGTLSEQPWVIRQHQAFRAVGNEELFYGGAPPLEFSNSRLIARSAWNSRWKIVIPAYTLLDDEQDGLDRFVASVSDIMLYLRTYSHSGN